MLLMVIALVAVGFYTGHMIQLGDPLAFYILCSFVVVYLLYIWKDKLRLVKRCVLAAPFVPLFAIVFRIAGFETVVSIHFGIFIFFLLLMRTDNWKRHFLITLTTAAILTFLLAYLKYRDLRGDLNVYDPVVISVLALPFVLFYAAYLWDIAK